ncbi:S1 family peptidase [Saccharothrix australiensis]|uniref:Streptogrisin C n=1 Tax=Saccharothrix australiensis TaxID=2072 RepID=A0A495W7S0_9PSEU|nr:S1 family peptidase [Saccharothrix australiensis]RKT57130.1 streptogrisin C [Saccharothrix australiensis]
MRTLLPVLFAFLALVATAMPASATPASATPPSATPASAATPLEAGTALTGPGGGRCVNGFNVRGHLLVSARCAGAGGVVRGPGGGVIGPVTAVRDVYGVVRVADPSAWDQLPRVAGLSTPVAGAAEAPVGATVCAAGRRTGWHCGTVQAKNQSVHYPEGTITGLTRANLCVQPGDDWLPVVSGDQAQGHLVGGSGCTAYFYPVNRILAAEGFTLVTA